MSALPSSSSMEIPDLAANISKICCVAIAISLQLHKTSIRLHVEIRTDSLIDSPEFSFARQAFRAESSL